MATKTKDSNLSIEEKLEQALIPNWYEPYKLPSNWCWVRVDAIASIYTGNSINEHVKKEKYTGISEGLVYLATKDIDFDSTVDYETNVRIPDTDVFKVAPKFSTLLCIEGGSAGRKIGFITQDVCFVNKLCAFVPNAKINPKYLYYAIQSDAFKKQFDAKKHGLIGGVSVKEVSSIYIPLAPIEQQTQIVELIESVFYKLNEATEKSQEVVDGFETRKAAIFHKAFSGELTAKWREEHYADNNWKKCCLSDIGVIITGSTPDTKNANFYGGTIPFIKPTELNQGRNVVYSSETLTEEGKKVSRPIRAGATCICCIGATIGKCGFLRVDAVTNQQINSIVPYDFMCDEFVYYYCNSNDFKNELIKNSSSTTLPIINKKKTEKLPIVIPSKDEQIEIASIIDGLIIKEQNAKKIAEAVIEQIDTIKKAILARAFRGELTNNDPSEESAVELLKQVLNTASEPKKPIKRATIPKALDNRIKTDLERKIIRLYFQNEVDILSIDLIMGVSSKKFEIMEALRNLQQRGLLEKQNDKYKLLG